MSGNLGGSRAVRQESEQSQKCIQYQASYHGSQLELSYAGELREPMYRTHSECLSGGAGKLGYYPPTHHPYGVQDSFL